MKRFVDFVSVMANRFKYVLLILVFIGVSPAKAGSYEDFFLAIQRNDAAAVTSLLQRGFDPNSRDPNGQGGLGVAVQNQSWLAVEALLAHPQLDVNALNAAGESALMLAAIKGNLAACQRLVDRGANVQHAGWSPIHYAATGPSVQIVEFLLDKGAAIDAVSPNGSTPLMMAARYGSEDSVNLLLRRGADVARRNERNLQAADFARLAGRESLAVRLARP
jgi:ankyrin repeat protein